MALKEDHHVPRSAFKTICCISFQGSNNSFERPVRALENGLLSVCELSHRHADAKLSTSPEDIFVDSVNAQLSLEWWDFLGDLEDEDED